MRSHLRRHVHIIIGSILTLLLVASTTTAIAAEQPRASGRSSVASNGSGHLPRVSGPGALEATADVSAARKLPHCQPGDRRLKCDIMAKYRSWIAYLRWVGKANPHAKWNKRERRYLRNHPGIDRKLGPTDIFRHPGNRGFEGTIRVRRDRRTKDIPAAAFAKGGGRNYCSTLTLRRKVESSIFRADLFTTYHKTKWCWDDNVVYRRHTSTWTEVSVHDRFAIINEGEIASYSGDLPTRGTWYSSQQWSICNCVFRYGAIGYWQPLWQVWARPGGKYEWRGHW